MKTLIKEKITLLHWLVTQIGSTLAVTGIGLWLFAKPQNVIALSTVTLVLWSQATRRCVCRIDAKSAIGMSLVGTLALSSALIFAVMLPWMFRIPIAVISALIALLPFDYSRRIIAEMPEGSQTRIIEHSPLRVIK